MAYYRITYLGGGVFRSAKISTVTLCFWSCKFMKLKTAIFYQPQIRLSIICFPHQGTHNGHYHQCLRGQLVSYSRSSPTERLPHAARCLALPRDVIQGTTVVHLPRRLKMPPRVFEALSYPKVSKTLDSSAEVVDIFYITLHIVDVDQSQGLIASRAPQFFLCILSSHPLKWDFSMNGRGTAHCAGRRYTVGSRVLLHRAFMFWDSWPCATCVRFTDTSHIWSRLTKPLRGWIAGER